MARIEKLCPDCDAPVRTRTQSYSMPGVSPDFECAACGKTGPDSALKIQRVLSVSTGAGGGSLPTLTATMVGKFLIDNSVAQAAVVSSPIPVKVQPGDLLIVAAGAINSFTPMVVKFGADTLTTGTEDVGPLEGGFYFLNGGFTSLSQTITVEPSPGPATTVGIIAYAIRGHLIADPIDQARTAQDAPGAFSSGATSALDTFNELAIGLTMGTGVSTPGALTYRRGFVRDAIVDNGVDFEMSTALKYLSGKGAVICSGTNNYDAGSQTSVITVRPR